MFGAVALVGAVGAASMQIMKGPVRAMSEVTKRTIAENNMIASSKLAIVSATTQANGGDCDGDMIVEPIPAEDPAGLPVPSGGGLLPATIGASLQDPWNTRYALCAWDHGPNNGRCGGQTGLIAGGATEDQYVLAVISAGPDRQFQTSCNAWTDADNNNQPDVPLLDKPPGSDDIVLGYTYAEANSAGGGLWVLKSGDPDKATIVKDLEVRTADDSHVAFALDRTTGQTEFLALKTDHIYARTSPNGLITLNDPLRIKNVIGMAAPTGGGGGGGGGGDNLGNHTATQNVQFLALAGGIGLNGAETDPKVGAVTNDKWCRGNGTQVVCDQDEPSGGGSAGQFDFNWTASTCETATIGKMMYADGSFWGCSPTGWERLMLQTGIPAPLQSWNGGYFVVTQPTTNGNLGGLAGADAYCLNELTSKPWRGQGEAQARGLLTSAKVKAWLCNGTTCQNGLPSTTYMFANLMSPVTGGDTYTTDASGLGPNIENTWNHWTYEYFWTGRDPGASNTTWPDTSNANHCSGWTSTAGNGRHGMAWTGSTSNSRRDRWSSGNTACNQLRSVGCFVHP